MIDRTVIDSSFPRIIALVVLGGALFGSVSAQSVSTDSSTRFGGAAMGSILKDLGADMEEGVSTNQIREYQSHFVRIDLDRDGLHSKLEFIEHGTYLNPQSRRGIFVAADRNRDGFVTEAEYVLNRIITDEAKAIVQSMDDDEDGVVERGEFVGHATESLGDAGLAAKVFSEFDSDGNDRIVVPEYLRVWGLWARSDGQSAMQRLGDLLNDVGVSETPAQQPFLNGRPGTGLNGGDPPVGFSIERLFRFDQNGDNQVSKAELPEFLQVRIMNRLDANKDGIIDRAEAALVETKVP